MNITIKSKVSMNTMAAADHRALKKANMPTVAHGMAYTPPVIATHPRGPKHENIFLISNETHSRETNNGYNRTAAGGFFCHWGETPTELIMSPKTSNIDKTVW